MDDVYVWSPVCLSFDIYLLDLEAWLPQTTCFFDTTTTLIPVQTRQIVLLVEL
jgi:hypothetical protein